MDMRKPIAPFYVVFNFIHLTFFPEAFYASVKKIHFCMGLPHTKVGFKKLIHVATIVSHICDFLNCCLFVVMLPRFLRAHGHAFSGLDEREFKGMGHRCHSPRLASVAGSGSCVLCCWFCCSFVHHLLPVRVSVVVRA